MSEEKVSRFSGKKLAIGGAAVFCVLVIVFAPALCHHDAALPFVGCRAVYRGPL